MAVGAAAHRVLAHHKAAAFQFFPRRYSTPQSRMAARTGIRLLCSALGGVAEQQAANPIDFPLVSKKVFRKTAHTYVSKIER